MVRHTESIPKYRQIIQDLTKAFESGLYEAGSRLPPQDKLAEQFNVSLLTIRQALGELERNGFISRLQGHGTFVMDRTQHPLSQSRKSQPMIAFLWGESQNPSPSSYIQMEFEVLARLLAGRNKHLGVSSISLQEIAKGKLPPLLMDESIAGILLEHHVQDIHIEVLKQHGLPFVVIGDYPIRRSFANVVFNQGRAAYLMSKALREWSPELPLYFLTEPFRLHYTHALNEGYSKACLETGQEPRLRMIFDETGNPAEDLQRIVKDANGRFSLLLHANIAQAALEVYKESGLKLSDCPIAIYGSADYVPPPMRERMNQIIPDIGLGALTALNLLDEMIERNEPKLITLEPSLTVSEHQGEIRMKASWGASPAP